MTSVPEVTELLGSINRRTTRLRLLLMQGRRGSVVLDLANAIRRDLALCEVLAEFTTMKEANPHD